MNKPLVVVVHGMGEHTAESVVSEVSNACNVALKSYKSRNNPEKLITDFVDIHAIAYDHIFQKEREDIGKNAEKLEALTAGLGLPKQFLEVLGNITEDNFVTTHILDLIFYASTHGPMVQLSVAEQLATLLAKYPGRDLHIIGHSLGTAVVNDTIHKLYSSGIIGSDGQKYALSKQLHPISSLWMFSNASQAYFDFNPFRNIANIAPYISIAKPSKDMSTAVRLYYNIMHKFDPLNLYPFEPKAGDGWISVRNYKNYYLYRETEHLEHDLNPHSLSNYILDPLVRTRFLSRIIPEGAFIASQEDKALIANLPITAPIPDEVSDAFSAIRRPESFSEWISNLKVIIEAIKEGSDRISRFGG
ncbi:hypothetical protein [Agarivorans sp. DSG3-1]|uniref:hypothetical protein n=1 Tax=Agarivorans sp. DSG3-1 TaxID=3342249 RepID=UPI00398F4A06